MKNKKSTKKKIILISVVSFLLALPLVLLPILSVVAYESIFGERYETASWLEFSVEDNGKEYCAETKEEFMNRYLDKKQCFEPDPVLMEQILNMFDIYCKK